MVFTVTIGNKTRNFRNFVQGMNFIQRYIDERGTSRRSEFERRLEGAKAMLKQFERNIQIPKQQEAPAVRGDTSAPPDIPAGSLKRLGRLAKSINLDHTRISQVFNNLQKSSHKQLKRALTVYKAARKLFPDDEEIAMVLERVRGIMKAAPKNKSRVKRIK